MSRRLIAGAPAAIIATLLFAAPVSAHGDHDARPVARGLQAGPFVVSLWQVYPDTGMSMYPHLIVMFDSGPVPAASDVHVTVDSKPMQVVPSNTTRNGRETTEGVVEGDVIAVAVSDGAQTWELAPVVVPPPPTSMLPMPELIYGSIFLTFCTAWWVVKRTARAWRRPMATGGGTREGANEGYHAVSVNQ